MGVQAEAQYACQFSEGFLGRGYLFVLVMTSIDLPGQIEEGGQRLGCIQVIVHSCHEPLPERFRVNRLGTAIAVRIKLKGFEEPLRRALLSLNALVCVGQRAVVVGVEEEEAHGV